MFTATQSSKASRLGRHRRTQSPIGFVAAFAVALTVLVTSTSASPAVEVIVDN